MGWVGEHIFKDTWAIPIKIGGQEGVSAYFSNPEYKIDWVSGPIKQYKWVSGPIEDF